MLKIKDEISLKELEKYGFIKTTKDEKHIDGYEFKIDTDEQYEYLIVPSYSRRIAGCSLDKVYDLIQEGLVVKED